MIATKSRESRRGKLRNARLLDKLCKEAKCRDCSVVVTRMDFAKILGKFTKVKIQYECSSPKSKKSMQISSPKPNSRLKNNENGMVQIHRNANKVQQIKNLQNQKKNKLSDIHPPSPRNNILKENNVLKRTIHKEPKTYSRQVKTIRKQYAIIFNEPSNNNNNDVKNEFCLADLLPHLSNDILPSKEWSMDYFPKGEEPKVDKVYDRIAAELEDLMCSDKPLQKYDKPEPKVDEFPSIMDILNDNTTVNNVDPKNQNNSLEFKSNLDSSDVEAMLLGKTNSADQPKVPEPAEPMEIDTTYVNTLINDVQSTEDDKPKIEGVKLAPSEINDLENPNSPSILDEALQKGIEEHLPADQSQPEAVSEVASIPKEDDKVTVKPETNTQILTETKQNDIPDIPEQPIFTNLTIPITHIDNVKYITFKKVIDGKCLKSVTCPKNLKYSIELDSKSVEFLGAPKYISSIDDLQVLLQIVNESDLQSLYVLY